MWRSGRPKKGHPARCTRSTPKAKKNSTNFGTPGASCPNGSNSSARKENNMAAKWIELVTGSLEQKKQFKQARARLEALPEPYLTAATAFNRYLMYYGGVTE